MKVNEITEQLQKIAPLEYAESWDNVGLLVGDGEQEVKKVMVALDATDQVIAQCISHRIDLLITHHPMIFSGIKKITMEDFIGRRILQMAQNHISYYAMHTNCDVCVMNQIAADKVGLVQSEILEPVKEDADTGKLKGIGQVGMLAQSMTVEELAQRVKKEFEIETVKITGDVHKKIHRVAVSTGSGKSFIEKAIKKGAEVFITGDIDHHSGIDALAQGLQIIDAGHYGTEHFMVKAIAEYLQKEAEDKLVIMKAEEITPFSYL